MLAAVNGFKQDRVNLSAEGGDRGDDFDLVFFGEVFGEALNTLGAGLNVGAAAFKSSDDFGAGDVVGACRVVQHLGEGRYMGGVGANDSETEVGGGGRDGTQ